MTVHVHKLEGCAPSPLAHYLKALAILRLVAEQADAGARGWWKDEAFWLAAKLTRDELLHFFLEEYEPTPILSPWNAGSGFYFRESKTGNKDPLTGKLVKTGVRDAPTSATRALEALIASTAPRLAQYRACAVVARLVVQDLGYVSAPLDTDKPALIAALRSRLPPEGICWLDAAVTSLGEEFFCAPLLGSGGNDGNEDFSKNYLGRVLELFQTDPIAEHRGRVANALFAETIPGAFDIAAGQFLPGGNGGINAGAGFAGRSAANAWDYLFVIEGAVLFAGGVARRLHATSAGATFPFAVRVDAVGYASAADKDLEESRLEVWLPLWKAPADLAEIRGLLSEGRAALDRTQAHRTIEFARAVAKLGTSRGVTSFERTAFLTRNGNMHYSVPVARWNVVTEPRTSLLDDVDEWVGRVRRAAREKNAPKAWGSACRAVEEALLAVCRGAGASPRWQALLIALGNAEAVLLSSPKTTGDPKKGLSPLPPLGIDWVAAANDGSVEFRLAIALAAQGAAFRAKDGETFLSVRGHWMPIERSHDARRAARFATSASGLAHDPDVVCSGRDLERDCLALVTRRVQMAPALKARGLGLRGSRGCAAPIGDVMAFLDGSIDEARVLALARPLMAVKWWEHPASIASPAPTWPDAAYAILRIAHLAEPLRREGGEVAVPLDPEPVARLCGGDIAGAVAVCLRRLRASGLTPSVRVVAGDPSRARRLAASLAFPIRAADASRCADLVTKPYLTDLV